MNPREMTRAQLANYRRREIRTLREWKGQDRTNPGAIHTIDKHIRASQRELKLLVG